MLQKTPSCFAIAFCINPFFIQPLLLDAALNLDDYILVGSGLMVVFVIFFYLLVLQLHRRRVIHQQEMFELKKIYEQTILQSQIEIQEQTFRNISQEIHDNIGQVLSLAKLNLHTVSAANTSEKITLSEELLGKAITDLRDLSKSLNTDKITDIGLADAIKNELAIIEKATKISKTTFVLSNENIPLDKDKTIVVFRMIQEILHNIVKHAKASEVFIEIEADENKTGITVKDNGVGFNPAALDSRETGIGLKSIQQRCRLIHGVCNIQSSPGSGTTVAITIQNNSL
ncbi:MAG TPA: sensor histidine kinase [Chitinophagaceae bacterium]|nr:sensor histidine kinase [Chitinophagaceae bacterium]